MQQEHLFYSAHTHQHALWTMADAVDAGTPIDSENGDDISYIGPVIHKTFDHIVALDELNALQIIDCSTGLMRRVLIDENEE